ncbi:hypothetical protein BDW59DRAFT_181913 [Aspergillus cavernicola]|uniref:N-acetyltransferase domain-containing protein n=1 Tax=Aspergillus cavernicola TaxID=176166 RepID=A0ABR4HRU1_9EURO
MPNNTSLQINVSLKLHSPSKAKRWDPRRASPGRSRNYSLTMADAWDIEEETREDIIAKLSLNPDSDLGLDLESLIPDWEMHVDPHAEFKWLEVIDGQVTHQQDSQSPVEQIGDCRAFLIRRDRILDRFWEDMEEPEEETADLAFGLFNRFSCLQPQFKDHPVKRGSGVWGDELNNGDILLIEQITIAPTHRRRGVGCKLIRALLELASKKCSEFVGITAPGILTEELRHEMRRSLLDENALEIQLTATVLSFFRSLGFRRIGSSRWFGYSPDMQHPSHSLPIHRDFDLPIFQRMPTLPNIDRLINVLSSLEDTTCLAQLQDLFGDAGPQDPIWEATDDQGNTLLHLVSCCSMTESTRWLMQRSPNLLSQRNAEGDTPLEALESSMEEKRTTRQHMLLRLDISDRFSGFDEAAISCLALLRGRDPSQLSESEIARLKFGCTCGSCLGGFLSPRLRDMLLFVVEITFDFIYTYGDRLDGDYWCEENEDILDYLPEPIARSLISRKDSRTGLCMLWKHLRTCIKSNMLPTEENILCLVRNSNEWPPHCRNFIQKGGSVSSIATMLFKKTMDLEEYYEMEQDENNGAANHLPVCRNDREIGVASGMCGYERVTRVQLTRMDGKKIRY